MGLELIAGFVSLGDDTSEWHRAGPTCQPGFGSVPAALLSLTCRWGKPGPPPNVTLMCSVALAQLTQSLNCSRQGQRACWVILKPLAVHKRNKSAIPFGDVGFRWGCPFFPGRGGPLSYRRISPLVLPTMAQAEHLTSCYWGGTSNPTDRHDPSLPYLEQYRIDLEQFKSLFGLLFSWASGAHSDTLALRFFRLLDHNGDGLINFREFVAGLSTSCGGGGWRRRRVSIPGHP